MFIITFAIAIVYLLGFITLLISPKTLTDSAYDIVILLVSGASISIAIYSELELNNESLRVEKMVKQINDMRKNLEDDYSVDKSIRYKLDKIIELDEEIYKKINHRKFKKSDKTSKQTQKEGSVSSKK